MPCPVCEKHKNLSAHTGPAILEQDGWLVTHFPKSETETEKATHGHLLIEPRRHIQDLSEMNEDEAQALGVLIREGAKRICERTSAEHVYCFRINDKVAHLHFHLIPRYPNTPKEFWGINIMACTTSPKLSTLDEIQVAARDLL